jgi:hypothetical protein
VCVTLGHVKCPACLKRCSTFRRFDNAPLALDHLGDDADDEEGYHGLVRSPPQLDVTKSPLNAAVRDYGYHGSPQPKRDTPTVVLRIDNVAWASRILLADEILYQAETLNSRT